MPPNTSSTGSTRERLWVMFSSVRYSAPNPSPARLVSASSSRYALTVRAWAKLSVSIAAVAPIRSCIPPEARRTRLPMRWIGTAASGYSSAANSDSSQSM